MPESPLDRRDQIGVGASDLRGAQRRAQIARTMNLPGLEEQQIGTGNGIAYRQQDPGNRARYRLLLDGLHSIPPRSVERAHRIGNAVAPPSRGASGAQHW